MLCRKLFDLRRIFGSDFVDVFSMRPIVILARASPEREYVEFLKHMLRELLLVCVGFAELRDIHFMGVLSYDFSTHSFDVSNKVCVIRLQGMLEDTIDEWERCLKNIARELHAQKMGYLVIYSDNEGILRKTQKILDRYYPRCTSIELLDEELARKLISSMWGCINPRSSETLDEFAVRAEDKYYRYLEKLAYEYSPQIPPSKPLNTIESVVHYGLKIFAIRCLQDRGETILMDPRGDKAFDAIIQDTEHGEVIIKVETLYNAKLPARKIKETIETTRGRFGVDSKTWIIVPNPQAILFANRILSIGNELDGRTRLLTLDIEKERLIPIANMLNEIFI